MKALPQNVIDDYIDTALESNKQIRALFAYEGENRTARVQNAKIAAVGSSNLPKVLSAVNNHRALELAARRGFAGEIEPPAIEASARSRK